MPTKSSKRADRNEDDQEEGIRRLDSVTDLSGYDDFSESEESSNLNNVSADEDEDLEDEYLESDEIPSEEETQEKAIADTDGKVMRLLPEIYPVYDSDDSDQDNKNTIGDAPLDLYDSFPHIGYDINGKRIMRPASGKALDALLESVEIPKGWTGVLDKATGEGLKLTDEELEVVKKISRSEVPEDDFNPYEDTIEYFTSKIESTPLSAAPEPKSRFVPSKHEAKKVMKIVKAIREGRIVPKKPLPSKGSLPAYDLWSKEDKEIDHPMHIPPPKMVLPGHAESYHPPPEYLPTEEEQREWEAHRDEKEENWLPKDHTSLRRVPGWNNFLQERFERCLDLYLAPRVRRNKLNIDPESLLPSLPSPQDLKPFPTRTCTLYRAHVGRVRCVRVHNRGLLLASGGDDGIMRVWETLTGRLLWQVDLSGGEINALTWGRYSSEGLLFVACESTVYVVLPKIWSPELEEKAKEAVLAGSGFAKQQTETRSLVKWSTAGRKDDSSIHLRITTANDSPIKQLICHKRCDYFATVASNAGNSAVVIHHLSKHSSQSPFKKAKGTIQKVEFHPYKPLLFVATQRYVKVYDLMAQVLIKTLLTGAKWISSIDVHPSGDHLIVGTYDRRVVWHDLDLTNKPYKTLRYHSRSVRDVAFHKMGQPLFCSASDDGSIQVFHGMVFNDLMQNPLLVGLKVLRGHTVTSGLGVLSVDWHPSLPFLFSAGADGDIRMWV